MQEAMTALSDLQRSIADALNACDVERVQDLVRQRQERLAVLAKAWRAASSAQREQHQEALRALQAEELTLLARCESLRDDLYARLTAGPRQKTPADRRETSTILDCQA